MDELAKEYVIDFFTKRLIHFKNSPESVGWTRAGQRLRYEEVLKLIEPSCKSLLDFGCGKGDFLGFLKEKKINCQYTGIDINPSLIELANKIYPEADFYVKDIEKESLERDFDYTISIGVFNLSVQGVKTSMQRCLEILFNHTKERVIFTCLNQKTKLKDIFVTYFTTDELDKIAKNITKKYQIFDNLIEGDLFLILEKD
ncbi:MAG: class I SAM-dependent methyltransferase [Thermodesulfovibrio sp.]|nr:class I SAM-dependent methyltransferase [Thermodesulfovibrio sp.]